MGCCSMNQFVCKECSYPSYKADSCDNPACLANPDLSESHKNHLLAMAEKFARERAEAEARIAFKKSLKKSGFMSSF